MPHLPPPQEDSDLRPYFWKFALLLITMFLFFRVSFKGPDYPVYTAYLDSIFQDGDLNIINNLASQDPQKSCGEALRGTEVTKTYNSSDFHNNGSTILWSPFCLYGIGAAKVYDLIIPGAPKTGLAASIAISSLAYSTIAMGFLSCLLIFLITCRYFPPRTAFWSTLIIFAATPAFFYTLVDLGNANIPALFMSTVLLLAAPTWLTSRNWRLAFLLGLLFALCVAIKIDLWFQIFMLGTSAFFFWFSGQLRPQNLLAALIGFGLGEIPKLCNDYIKFGDFHSGEAGIINLHNSYHLQQLISPYRGFLTVSPVLGICFAALLLLVYLISAKSSWVRLLHAPDQALQRLMLAMGIWLVAKLFIIGFRFAWGGGTFGARQLLTELPLFVLLLNFLLTQNQALQYRWLRWLLPAVLATTILINLVQAGEFFSREKMPYFLNPPNLVERLAQLRFLGSVSGQGFSQFLLKLPNLPLLLLTLWLTRVLLSRFREIETLLAPWEGAAKTASEIPNNRLQSWLKGLTIYMLLAWFTISGLNAINNQANVKAMTDKGCFKFVTVVPPNWFELNENVDSMNEMVHYFILKGDLKEVEHIRAICKLLYPAEYHRLSD